MLTSGPVFVTILVTLTFLVDFDCVVVFLEDDIVKTLGYMQAIRKFRKRKLNFGYVFLNIKVKFYFMPELTFIRLSKYLTFLKSNWFM